MKNALWIYVISFAAVGAVACAGLVLLPPLAPSAGYLRTRLTGEARPDPHLTRFHELRAKGNQQIDENVTRINKLEGCRTTLWVVVNVTLLVGTALGVFLATNVEKAAAEVNQSANRWTRRFWLLLLFLGIMVVLTPGLLLYQKQIVSEQQLRLTENGRWRDAINQALDDLDSASSDVKKDEILNTLHQELQRRGATTESK